MSPHPDPELLAAHAAGEPGPDVDRHLADCAECRGRVDALRRVAADLAALPPLTMPVDVAASLDAALAAERARPAPGGNVLPLRRRRVPGWAAGAVAASVVAALAVGVVLRPPGSGGGAGRGSAGDQADRPTNADAAAGTRQYATGFAYSEDNVGGAVTALLAGNPSVLTDGAPAPREAEGAPTPTGFDSGAGAGPTTAGTAPTVARQLAELRMGPALDACLAELRPRPDAVPLLIDYGSYAGRPAMVVVFPFDAERLDVWVVGERCGRPAVALAGPSGPPGPPDADLLLFTRVARPS